MTSPSEPLDWKALYREAYEQHQAREYPAAVRDHGHLKCTYPKVHTANGLSRMVANHLTWTGGHGEVTKNMGTPRKKTYQKFSLQTGGLVTVDNGIEWRPGAGTKGTTDVKGHMKIPGWPHPVPVYAEIKIGRDTMRDAQERYRERVASTGALHVICKTPEDWFRFWLEKVGRGG